jgi:hypothetical protein
VRSLRRVEALQQEEAKVRGGGWVPEVVELAHVIGDRREDSSRRPGVGLTVSGAAMAISACRGA